MISPGTRLLVAAGKKTRGITEPNFLHTGVLQLLSACPESCLSLLLLSWSFYFCIQKINKHRASSYLAGCLAGDDGDFDALLQPLLVPRSSIIAFPSYSSSSPSSSNYSLTSSPLSRPPGSSALTMARQHIVDHLQQLGWQVFILMVVLEKKYQKI